MAKTELTLKDRLSRLTFTQACKLLGPDGNRLIVQGGKFSIDTLSESVYLGDDLFRLSVNGAVVTITLMAEARNRLHFHCNCCDSVCDHIGAAFALVLEEKTALGLAKPPVERTPVESLSEAELIERALEDRLERAKTERMTIKSTNPRILWTDYLVTNSLSGKSYRVALRGWERGECYCSCPDFRKNTLGTCKHIMKVQRKVERQFSGAARNRPYRQKEFAVHIAYGNKMELRLLCPDDLDGQAAAIVRPVANRPAGDILQLIGIVRKLESAGHAVTLYSDAQEYIDFLLHQEHIRALVQKIRANPAAHPLRSTLLKTELLPYQMDGVAFAVGAGRAVLADDMGLGKTIQGIGVAELMARESSVGKVLIVCPTTLKSQWRSEIGRFSGRSCQLVLGSGAERAAQSTTDASLPYAIMNRSCGTFSSSNGRLGI